MSTSKRISVVAWIILPSLFLLSGSDKALAKKGKGGSDGGQNLAIHGCITFRDQEAAPRDRIRSDGWGAYCDATDSLIGLLNFFQFNE